MSPSAKIQDLQTADASLRFWNNLFKNEVCDVSARFHLLRFSLRATFVENHAVAGYAVNIRSCANRRRAPEVVDQKNRHFLDLLHAAGLVLWLVVATGISEK